MVKGLIYITCRKQRVVIFEQLFGLRKSETCIYVSQYIIIFCDHVLGAIKLSSHLYLIG